MPDPQLKVEGDDYLALGADQYTNPQKLPNGKYVNSMNTIARGGMPQTRPGSRTMMTLPDGNLQGMTVFKPASGTTHLVVAVDGLVYVSPYPFTTYTQLQGIQFDISARYIAWANCLKSTDYDTEGQLYFLDNPYSVLIMQDGLSRAAMWDGSTARHLNPTSSTVYSDGGEIITQPGLDETPLGLWMQWANNRLWLSRGNQVFASDIGNPTKFTERQYINEARSFLLPDNCTGIVSTTDQQGIICFTEQTGTFFMSSLQDRTQWVSTTDFQKLILPSVGCVAPRSITTSYGLVWWYSARGLMNQNDAVRANLSSKLDVQDNAMFETKAGMSYDLSGVASAVYENFMLTAVPFEDRRNTRTMVMDQTPLGDVSAQFSAYSSYWTGWMPVEFASTVINGEGRIFCASADYDGKNRIWELFTEDRTDNGIPITCFVQTREHMFADRDFKKFQYAEIELRDLEGEVAVQISVAGIKGAWQPMGTKDVVATHGQIYDDEEYDDEVPFYGCASQSRLIKTQFSSDATAANALPIESEDSGLIDKGFSLLIVWSGKAALQCYRIFCVNYPKAYQGNCEIDESGTRLLTPMGYGSEDIFCFQDPFTEYSSTQSYSAVDQATGLVVSYEATATSIISQADAARKALLSATQYVQTLIGQL